MTSRVIATACCDRCKVLWQQDMQTDNYGDVKQSVPAPAGWIQIPNVVYTQNPPKDICGSCKTSLTRWLNGEAIEAINAEPDLRK